MCALPLTFAFSIAIHSKELNMAYNYEEEEARFPSGLENNSPNFKDCCIGDEDSTVFPPYTISGWTRLGELIGAHEHVTSLSMCDVYTIGRAPFEAMMRGVACNRSLQEVSIIWCNGVWGSFVEILTPFMEQNNNLIKFDISLCDNMHRDEIHSLSSTFGNNGGRSLRVLRLSQNNMTDVMVAELIPSLTGLTELRELHLGNNMIGMRQCESFVRRPQALENTEEGREDYMSLMRGDGARAELIERHRQYLIDNNNTRNGGIDALSGLLSNHPTLELITLGSNGLTNDSAEVLAGGLSQNKVLKRLALSDLHQANGCRNDITEEKGWGALARALGGNGSSIKDTYDANHTVESLTDSYADRSGYDNDGFKHPLTSELESLLKLNKNDDKKAVARQKVILLHHVVGSDEIESFDEPDVEQKLLPSIIAWIGKGDSVMTGVFEFCRTNPSLCEV